MEEPIVTLTAIMNKIEKYDLTIHFCDPKNLYRERHWLVCGNGRSSA